MSARKPHTGDSVTDKKSGAEGKVVRVVESVLVEFADGSKKWRVSDKLEVKAPA